MTKRPNDSPDDSGGPDLSGFGLDLVDEQWLARLRRASSSHRLGRLNGYELLEEVSRGAQGIVYRARDVHRDRPVAIKRLLAGSFATDASRARFEREMEAAASLRHANIVAVYNTGLADHQPLLVMEWVDGLPVDRWADRHRQPGAGVDQLLALFMKICAAVHHAHQRGVIHRDLKPSNILIDPHGEPHLLDFGLAKLTGVNRFDQTTLTRTSEFIGTPAYAAPEQVRGEHHAVDVRTDVYALGAILFRMLTGQLPFEAHGNLADLLHAIQHTDAPRPSACNPALDDDIDAIIAKAMAGQAEHRYSSVDALAADVNRHASDEPIEAKRGRGWYVFRKTLKRYRAAICLAAVCFVVLAGATVALTAMYARQARLLVQVTTARDAETRARHAAQQQQAVLESLLAAAAGIGKGTDIDVRRAWLDEATRLVEAGLMEDPNAQAAAYDTIGRTYQSLGLYAEAEHHLRTALDLREQEHPIDHPELATSLFHLGQLLQDCNRFDEGEPYLRDALAMRRRLFTGDHPDVAASLNAVGLVLQYSNDYVGAESLHREALEMSRRLYGHAHPDIAYALNQIGNALANRREYEGAEALYRDALQMYSELFGEEHRDVAASKINVAKALFNRGEYAEAEPLFREAIETYRRLLGDWHDNVAWGLHRLGLLLQARGEYIEAESTLRESLAIYRRCFEDSDPFVAMVLDSLARLLIATGAADEAARLYEEALAIRRKLFGEDHPDVGRSLVNCGVALRALGRLDESQAFIERGLEQQRRTIGVDHPDVARGLLELATTVDALGDPERADEARGEAARIVAQNGGTPIR